MPKSTTTSLAKVSRRKTHVGNATNVESGSGNVFADLGLPDSALAIAKAEIVQKIRSIIRARGLSQTEAAKCLGVDQPKVSGLVRGRVEGYSLDRLFRFLNLLGQEVEISIRPWTSSPSAPTAANIVVTLE